MSLCLEVTSIQMITSKRNVGSYMISDWTHYFIRWSTLNLTRWYPFPRHGLLSSKQRLKRWKGATGITRIQIFQPYSLRRHYHICLKATLWNTLQRDHCKELNWNLVTTLQLLRLRHPTSVSKRGLYENQGVGSYLQSREMMMEYKYKY